MYGRVARPLLDFSERGLGTRLHKNMNASDGEEESEELALFRQQWRQELGIAQPTPGRRQGPEEEVSI